MRVVYGDICDTTCEAIVNASNGIGYMGGKTGVRKRLAGVAESIHYLSGGRIEEDAKKICKGHSPFGFAPGNVFVTDASGLQCRYIIHAVTMRLPGSRSSIAIVESLMPKILEQARNLGIKSLAIPLLGTGTGHVNENRVMQLYRDTFEAVDDLDVVVYIYQK